MEKETVTNGIELLSMSSHGKEQDVVSTGDRTANRDYGHTSLVHRMKLALKVKGADKKPLSAEKPLSTGGLKKELNLFSLVAFVVGSIIGSGIFITPRTILCLTGSFGLSMVVWLIGGVFATAGGLCYVELGLLIQKSGAEYGYIKEAYSFKSRLKVVGEMLSFLYIWASVLVIRPSSLSIISLTSARYLVRPFYIGCEDIPESAVKLLALCMLIITAMIHCSGVKRISQMMSVFFVAKLLAVLFVVILGVSFMIRTQSFPESFTHPFEFHLPGHELSVSQFSLSLYGVVWTYDGWSVAGNTVEESKKLKRNLPLSLLIGVPVVTAAYLLINVCYFAVLDFEQLLSAKAVALPFGVAAIGTAGLVVIPLLIAVSTFGALQGSLFIGSRVQFAAARDGLLPDFLSGLHVTAKTPVPAIILQVFLAMVMVVTGTIDQLINGFSALSLVVYAMTSASVVILRVTHQKEPRLFKAWFILPIAVAMSSSCGFLVLAPFFNARVLDIVGPVSALGFTLLGLPVFVLLAMEHPRKIRPNIVDKLSSHVSVYVNNVLNTQTTRELPND